MRFKRECRRLRAALLLLAALPLACREKPRFNYDFERKAVLDDLSWQCRTLYRLSSYHSTEGANSLEVTFHPTPKGDGESYPGLSLHDFDPDWTNFRTLVFDAFNPEENGIRLSLRIDDRKDPDYSGRFNAEILLNSGDNHITIPFSGMVISGARQPLNLKNITRVVLFLANPKETNTIFFDGIRLE